MLLEHIPPMFRAAWICMQADNRTRVDNTQLDAAAFELADLFAHPHIVMPFRLPTLDEQIREAELVDLLQSSPFFEANQIGDAHLINFLGNYFKPSALTAVVTQENGASDLRAFLLQRTRIVPVIKPTTLSTIERKYNTLCETVRKDPRFKRFKFCSQASLPCPETHSYLLKEEFYAQLRLFSKVAVPDIATVKQYLHTAFERTTLLAKQEPVCRPLPVVDSAFNAVLHASLLAKQQNFSVTYTNRHMLPDPAGHIASLPEGHGQGFVDVLVPAVIASFSGCRSLDTACIVFAPHLGIRRILGKGFRVRKLFALICNTHEACFSLIASSCLPFECHATNRVSARISSFAAGLHNLLIEEADILAFKNTHACPPFLSDALMKEFEVACALVQLSHLKERLVLFFNHEGHFQFDAASTDAALRLFSDSAVSLSLDSPPVRNGQLQAFATNFHGCIQSLVVCSTTPCVVCSFSLEHITSCLSPGGLEEALFRSALDGAPVALKFHSFAISGHLSVAEFLQALSIDSGSVNLTQCIVFVHLVCRYDALTHCAPATIAVRSSLVGLRKLPHIVSSLITAGIGEAHPT